LIDDDAKIWTIDSDGGDRRELAVGERPLWSPDGTRIAFIRRSDNVIPFDTVWTMDADGGHQRLVARADVAGWSPNGRWLAYSTDDDVRIVAATGGPSRVLSRKAEVSAIRWSPDGRWVLVEAAGKSFLVRSDGSMVRALDGTDGAWSPDGRTIAVRRSRPCSRGALYLVDVDGTSERQLTRGDYDDDEPSWSPTGDRIAFTRGPGGLGGWERNEIYAVSLADGAMRRLTENDYDDSSPRWRPLHERAALPVVKVPRLPANRPPEPGELPLPVLRRSPPLKPLEPVRMPAPTVTVLEPPPYSARVLSLPKLPGCEAN
jgi:Tol biopolymer transport system component